MIVLLAYLGTTIFFIVALCTHQTIPGWLALLWAVIAFLERFSKYILLDIEEEKNNDINN